VSVDWKLFLILWVASVFSVMAIVPYILTLQADLLKDLPIPLHILLPIQLVQNAVLFAVFVFFGLYLAKRVGFGAPLLERLLERREAKAYLKSILGISIASGVLVSILIAGIDYLFSIFVEPSPIDQPTPASPPIWQRFLASFYGGVGEEVIMRLFLMSLLVWAFSKIKRTDEVKPNSFSIWLAIIITAILFGVGHLPFAATLAPLTPLATARIIFLNGIGGIVFGWLYWRKGLESAMISHFSAAALLNVIFPSL